MPQSIHCPGGIPSCQRQRMASWIHAGGVEDPSGPDHCISRHTQPFALYPDQYRTRGYSLRRTNARAALSSV